MNGPLQFIDVRLNIAILRIAPTKKLILAMRITTTVVYDPCHVRHTCFSVCMYTTVDTACRVLQNTQVGSALRLYYISPYNRRPTVSGDHGHELLWGLSVVYTHTHARTHAHTHAHTHTHIHTHIVSSFPNSPLV